MIDPQGCALQGWARPNHKEVAAVYARVFGDHRPARTTIQAAALPGKGLRVEIDAIAYVP